MDVRVVFREARGAVSRARQRQHRWREDQLGQLQRRLRLAPRQHDQLPVHVRVRAGRALPRAVLRQRLVL